MKGGIVETPEGGHRMPGMLRASQGRDHGLPFPTRMAAGVSGLVLAQTNH
jgi:hypothetical protein